MSTDEQARAYLREARLTLESARVIHEADDANGLWAQVVKNGYDAIEQAVSAGIANRGHSVPRRHPAKVNAFIDRYEPPSDLEELLLYWLQRRSDTQYVDIRDDEVNVPHEQFDRSDAGRVLEDAEQVLTYVQESME
jgi:HEPN domain-containing protein